VGSKNLSIAKQILGLFVILSHLILVGSVTGVQGQCVPPPTGMISWWPGDGTLNDIIGKNNGIMVGDTTFALGLVDQALSFGEKCGYMITPNVIKSWPEGTVDLWVKFNSLSENPDQIFSSLNYDLYGNVYCPIHMWASGGPIDAGFTFGFCIGNASSCTWQLAYSNVPPVVGKWYHLAGTWGSEGIKIYVDAVLKATTPYFGSAPSTTNHMIGASFVGLIDEVEIFNRALSPDEILTIHNAGSAGKCKTVTNHPPVAKCKEVSVPAGPSCSASASINNGSYDPDGDPIELTQSPAGPYPLGKTLVTLTVSDSHGASSSCTDNVTVVDNSPPTITKVSATPSMLWPPNHKMVPVRVIITASDNCSGTPQCGIVSVASNEPVNGLGDGDTSPDWQFPSNSLIVNLRAERSGQRSGRIYTVGVQCSDASGNKSPISTVQVRVPHDQKEISRRKVRLIH
jgi:hypothetical protein